MRFFRQRVWVARLVGRYRCPFCGSARFSTRGIRRHVNACGQRVSRALREAAPTGSRPNAERDVE